MVKNVVLIGMPGAGKSTLGALLAKQLQRPFVDTDTLIECQYKKTLQQLVDENGYLRMRALEGEVIASASFANPCIIATGGSAVYSAQAMAHLKASGVCVYLAAQLATILERVTNFGQRGFNKAPSQTVDEVFNERQALYQQYADYTVNVDQLTAEQALQQVLGIVGKSDV